MSEGNKGAVFVGCPTYSGQVEFASATACHRATNRKTLIMSVGSSLLAFGFNQLWCAALNARAEHGVEWFAMLHGDILPEHGWADKLIAEAEEHDADVMSAVVPFKSDSGLTSTAMACPKSDWVPQLRLTQKQVNHPSFPKTFDSFLAHMGLWELPEDLRVESRGLPTLLVNSGCMVCRITKPWAEQVCFTIKDRIHQRPDGKFECNVQSEDWNFSRDVHALGGKVMATTKVHLKHRGPTNYDSTKIWGENRDHLLAESK